MKVAKWVTNHAISTSIINDKLRPESLNGLWDVLSEFVQVAVIVIIRSDLNPSLNSCLS